MTAEEIAAGIGHVVWQATLDDAYDVRVVRLEPAIGEISIREIGEPGPFAGKIVSFSYSAMFGPDVDDVADWQAWAIEQVENRKDAPITPIEGNPHEQ